MTALKNSGLFQFSLLTVIVITFKFSLQTLFVMPENSAALYDTVYSSYTQHPFSVYLFYINTYYQSAPDTLVFDCGEMNKMMVKMQWFPFNYNLLLHCFCWPC